MIVHPPVDPPQHPGGIEPDGAKLQDMNRSALDNASPVQGAVLPCQKKSWFAIRLIDEKDTVVEGLTLKLKLTGLGEAERITSKANDPVKIEQLDPGGKGDVLSIDAADGVWEAVGGLS